MNNDHRLYIIMRDDMASLNPGKACAQAAHAANKFIYQQIQTDAPKTEAAIAEWQQSSGKYLGDKILSHQGFGTTIVLSSHLDPLKQIIEQSQQQGLEAGLVFDESYPLLDGMTVHHIPLITCGYVFVPKHDEHKVPSALHLLKLMK